MTTRTSVDWARLLHGARTGGVAPLLYQATRGAGILPSHLEDELRSDYFANAQRNLLLFAELERVLAALEEAKLPVIVLKGAALAEAVYDNVAVRPMGDVDLLLREQDVPEALHTLRTAGYEIIPPRAYRCEVTVRRPGRIQAPIEVHWGLFVQFYYQYALPMDWFWATSRPLDVGDRSSRMLGPEAQILHLCGHLLLHHGHGSEPRLLWLYDLAAVIARYQHHVDWDTLLARAGSCDLVVPLQRYLPRLHQAWRAPVPPALLPALAALEPSPKERRIVERLDRAPASAAERLRQGLADLPGWRPRLRFAWRNVFPPARYLEQVYQVPHPLLIPLTYPYRWLAGVRSVVSADRSGE